MPRRALLCEDQRRHNGTLAKRVRAPRRWSCSLQGPFHGAGQKGFSCAASQRIPPTKEVSGFLARRPEPSRAEGGLVSQLLRRSAPRGSRAHIRLRLSQRPIKSGDVVITCPFAAAPLNPFGAAFQPRPGGPSSSCLQLAMPGSPAPAESGAGNGVSRHICFPGGDTRAADRKLPLRPDGTSHRRPEAFAKPRSPLAAGCKAFCSVKVASDSW